MTPEVAKAENNNSVKFLELPDEIIPVNRVSPDTKEEMELGFVRKEVLRGDNKGEQFYCPPELTPDNFEVSRKWFGTQMLCDVLNGIFKQKGINMTRSATAYEKDSSGEEIPKSFSRETFVKYGAEWQVRGESIGELKVKIEDILASVEAESNKDVPDTDAIKNSFIEIKKLKEHIKFKERPRKVEEAVAA